MKTKSILLATLSLLVASTTFGQRGVNTPATSGTKKNTVKTSGTKGNASGTVKTSSVPTTSGTTNGGGRGAVSSTPATPVLSADDPFKDLITSTNAKPVVQSFTNGSVNYSEQYVEAKGTVVINTDKFPNRAQAKLMAERGAIAVAQRNLLELTQEINIVGETTVKDLGDVSDLVISRVEGKIKGAKQFGPSREVDGTMEVTLRMPLYTDNGFAGAFDAQVYNKARQVAQLDITSEPTPVDPSVPQDQVIDGSKPTIFNLNGQSINPSMFPVVYDENGNVALDFSKIYQSTGQVPKILDLSKDLMKTVGFNKGVDVIDFIQDKATGKITLADTNKKGKIDWKKIGNVAGKIGKILLNVFL
jgi:hypothetical protein